jgi:carboxypeptidase family protein
MAQSAGLRARTLALAAVLAFAWTIPGLLPAQSITEGRVFGEVVSPQGAPIGKPQVTLLSQSTGQRISFKADYLGRFNLSLIAPGTYSVLVELVGYQPVRQNGVRVFAGRTTNLRIALTRRPPPITSIQEIPYPERGEPSTGTSIGQYFNERELKTSPWRSDLSDLSRGSSIVSAPRDGHWGYADMAGGLPQSQSKIYVDGLPGFWLRHPGLPNEPVGSPVYLRNMFEQAQIIQNSFDGEWRGGPGTTLSGYSRRGSNTFKFEPYVTFSGKQALATEDNPADSSVTSIQAGAVLSGALIKNSAQFVAGFDYQQLEQPSAAPWAEDSASYGGAPVSLSNSIARIANDSFGQTVDNFTQPTLRSWKGGSGGARLDWQLSKSPTNTQNLMARFSVAKWKEDDPILGQDVLTNFGTDLDARDFSGGLTLSSMWLNTGNEFRFAHRTTNREWAGPSLPTTYFVGEAAGIGTAPATPGNFKANAFDITETLHWRVARSHVVKAGFQFTSTSWTQSYTYGRDGIFQFGDLDQFGNAEGTYFRTVTSSDVAEFKTTDWGLFGQDAWQVDPGIVVTFGIGWSRQKLPTKSSDNPINPNTAFQNAFNRNNQFMPNDQDNLEPRFGLVWDVNQKQEWIVRAGGSLTYGLLDPATLSEAVVADGGLRVRRGQGTFSSWPVNPDTVAAAPFVGDRITFIDNRYEAPRTAKLDGALTRTLNSGVAISLSGGYHHTDYILRRSDINLPDAPLALSSEGRPIYGTLVQQGGMITPAPNSNRRFTTFDMVSEMAPTGFSDYYEAGIEIARRPLTGLSFVGSYTYSHTTDNWSSAPGSGDPEDQLSPFPNDPVGSEWIRGRSDFDIPHRARITAAYRTAGKYPIGLGARYRFRSGLPFTPGFRAGVDANGDGSGRNDPAYLDLNTPGMSGVVSQNACLQGQAGLLERNSCREASNHALDLSASVGIPVGSSGNLQVTLDAFNVVATETGLVDRALLLIDPTGSITTDAQGNVVLPLVANQHFGKLLIRRGEGRVVRIGLRVGY